MNKTVSIIIRTKNEERWISNCLSSVFNQKFKDFEVIIVDSGSKDKTIEKARQFPVKIVCYSGEYKPGKAINLGVKNSSGKYIVCLSGHCIPVNNQWLENLVSNIEPADVAGVYGRQEPLSFSSDFDKRDLLFTFGLDKKTQTKDSFFHNANSIIKRTIWNEIPFDEEVGHIEDRIWAKAVLKKDYKIVYTPDSRVYHYHGIHQNANSERCKEIVEILEGLEEKKSKTSIDENKLNIAAVIPVRGAVEYLGGRPLIEYTLKRAFQSKYLKHIAVTTDNPEIADIARGLGIHLIFIYPPELSAEYIEIQDILRYAISQFEKRGIMPDVIVYLSPTYPFRPKDLIDRAISRLIRGGYDSILPVIPESRSCWLKEENKVRRVDMGFIPSKFKNPLLVGISGLITAAAADIIKWSEDRLGHKMGMIELDNILYSLDTGKLGGAKTAELLINDWWSKNQ